jgi:hypothetical protein
VLCVKALAECNSTPPPVPQELASLYPLVVFEIAHTLESTEDMGNLEGFLKDTNLGSPDFAYSLTKVLLEFLCARSAY